jgi:DHA1 family multidrug resistance protein-like MFS transporter
MKGWKKNLFILGAGQFLVMAVMSSISPFLPLYIQELGVSDEQKVSYWSGIIFGVNFFSAFIFSPIWGKLADRHGRKVMVIRSGLGMAITTTLMGFVTSPLQLFFLRMLNGVISGFIPASIALLATTVPKKKVGYALGTLQACGVSGAICGPVIGGLMADRYNFSTIFSFTGLLIFIAAMLVILFVKEDFVKSKNPVKTSFKEDFKKIVAIQPIPALFVVATTIQLATMGTLPLLSIFVQELTLDANNLALLSGITMAVMGFSNMLASPQLGKLGDKYGSERVLLFSILAASLIMIPQAFVTELWQLIILRFLLGLCLGGMLPSINALIRHYAPAGMESRTFGYSNSSIFLGNMMGPIISGLLSANFGVRSIFIWASLLLMTNLIWVRFKVVAKINRKKQNQPSSVTSK